jgi:3-oxoacyl-[acyl-carrier protein] reductase
MKNLKGKIALVTGSSRGIGKAIAERLEQDGAVVISHSSKMFDVADKQSVEKGCKKIVQKYGHVDILVNNAGIVRNSLFTKMTFDDWDRVLKTNLYGPFWVTKMLLPAMTENRWGRVINLSSISGIRGDFGQTNYSASKAGIIGFTKSLAKEVARYNITVNAIVPGLVDTDILNDVPEKYMSTMLSEIPMGRKAKPEEIASLAAFLASDEASYITGSVVHIDGGWR